MERRHYITALFLLLLPVVVIYSLTSFGMEESAIKLAEDRESVTESVFVCKQKQSPEKGEKALHLKKAATRHLK
ncbi:MAG: hypothetical protein KJN76_02040 [Eudoraea sp.]|nr:hypothetical protein [Eudoraea sp.]